MALHLKVISDFVCPYCYLLEAYFQRLKEKTDLEIEIEHLPFELTERAAPQEDPCNDPERRERYARQLAPACRAIGLAIKLPPDVSPRPYTDLAFRGWHYAEEQGVGDAYYERVFRAYFEEERDIGQPQVLEALAADVGLDPAAFRAALEQDAYAQKQRAAVCYVRETLQPRMAPTILAGEKRLEGFIPSVDALKAWLQEVMWGC